MITRAKSVDRKNFNDEVAPIATAINIMGLSVGPAANFLDGEGSQSLGRITTDADACLTDDQSSRRRVEFSDFTLLQSRQSRQSG
jgi:hypothetical protein